MQLFMIACSWTAVWKSSLSAAVLLAALQPCEFSHQEGGWNSLTQTLTAIGSGPLILLSHFLSHDLAIKILSCWPKYKLGNKQSQCKVLLCCTNCLALGARWIVLLSSIESVSLVQIHLCCKKKKHQQIGWTKGQMFIGCHSPEIDNVGKRGTLCHWPLGKKGKRMQVV